MAGVALLYPLPLAVVLVSTRVIVIAVRRVGWVEDVRHAAPPSRWQRAILDAQVLVLAASRFPRPVVEALDTVHAVREWRRGRWA